MWGENHHRAQIALLSLSRVLAGEHSAGSTGRY
jgi:hypothetical protein